MNKTFRSHPLQRLLATLCLTAAVFMSCNALPQLEEGVASIPEDFAYPKESQLTTLTYGTSTMIRSVAPYGNVDCKCGLHYIVINFNQAMQKHTVKLSLNPSMQLGTYTWNMNRLKIGLVSKVQSGVKYTATITGKTQTGRNIVDALNPWSFTMQPCGTTLPVVSVVKTSDAIEGGTAGGFTFTRTGSTTQALTVSLTTGGTATNGTDYQSIGTTVTFPAGSSTVTLPVTPIDDTLVEGLETVIVSAVASSGYTLGAASSATVNLNDNDFPTLPVVTVATTSDATEGGTAGEFTFTRTGSTTQALTVTLTTSGTATNSTDYQTIGTTVTFPAGSSTVSLPVTTLEDDIVEGLETVVVTTVAGSEYTLGAASSATVNLNDNDSYPVVTVVATTDATEGGTAGEFTFTRTGSTTQALTVTLTTSGTATNSTDYQTIGTTITFPPGSSTVSLPVNTLEDDIVEGLETVIVTVGAGSGYTIGGTSSATVNLNDNDSYPVVTVATTSDATEGGTAGEFTFTRTGNTTQALTVTIATSGTATNGTDYQSIGTTVTFPVGSSTVSLPVTTLEDDIVEGLETVIVTTVAGSEYTLGAASSATVNLNDNDLLPVVTVYAQGSACELPITTGRFILNRTGELSQPLTVNISMAGTATNGNDYTTVGATVTFAAGNATEIVLITPITQPFGSDGNETVILNVLAGTGYTLGANPGSNTLNLIKNCQGGPFELKNNLLQEVIKP